MPIQLGDLKLYSLKELSKILGITTFTLRAYFRDTQETKKDVRISLQGITNDSKVTDEDIEKTKGIHAKGIKVIW